MNDDFTKSIAINKDDENEAEASAIEASTVPSQLDFERVNIEVDPVAAGYFIALNNMIDDVCDAKGVKGDGCPGPSGGYYDSDAGLHFAYITDNGCGRLKRIVEQVGEHSSPKPVYVFESFGTDAGGLVIKFRSGSWSRRLRQLAEETREHRKAPIPIGRPELIKFGTYMTEPIIWRVYPMSDGTRLAVADHALDFLAFDEDANDVWEESTLKLWMDEKLSYDGFSTAEWSRVSPPGLFLLDERHAEALFDDDRDRQAWPTAWATSKMELNNRLGASPWWLSTPSKYCHMLVNEVGRINRSGLPSDRVCGVRPAFYLAGEEVADEDAE